MTKGRHGNGIYLRKLSRDYVTNLRFKGKFIAEEYGGETWSLL